MYIQAKKGKRVKRYWQSIFSSSRDNYQHSDHSAIAFEEVAGSSDALTQATFNLSLETLVLLTARFNQLMI